MNKDPIGVIDSGVGGLTIFREIVKVLPSESIIYLADQKNCPYGEKSEEEIYELSRKLVRFLIAQKVKLIVIACNTITVSCIEKLRKDFPKIPIVGTVPVVKTASKITKNGRIGILSTKQTAGSKYQKSLIEKFAKGLKVLNLGANNLVPLVENGPASKIMIEKILREELKPFINFRIDTLVLGCTHFPLLKSEMRKILGSRIEILDSGGAIARQTKRILDNNSIFSGYNKPSYLFYTTGDLKKFKTVSQRIINPNKGGKWQKISL